MRRMILLMNISSYFKMISCELNWMETLIHEKRCKQLIFENIDNW